MNVEQAYNKWSEQYDSNENKTRDMEAKALRKAIAEKQFDNCLEIGCGTGKNTSFLITRAKHVTAVDVSAEMLAKAKQKIQSNAVAFVQFDILQDWTFTNRQFNLVIFSLVLEHVEDIDAVFNKLAKITTQDAVVYISELHPFKQYSGSKARFETSEGVQVVPCYTHHLSAFVHAARKHNFYVEDFDEYFDDDDQANIPRIFTLLLQRKV